MEFALQDNVSRMVGMAISWAPKLVGAIIVLVGGFWVVGMVINMVGRGMDAAGLDRDVQPFLKSVASVILKLLVVISAAGLIGIEITAFAALLAAGGLAIGMALQGTLGHFASGVMILIFKPYRVGDLVDLQGKVGRVKEIQIFNTVLISLGRKIIIPNGIATNGVITNLSSEGSRRVDLNVTIPYEEDFETVKNLIATALKEVPNEIKDEPVIVIEKLNVDNILIAVRQYATPDDYWNVHFESYRLINAAFSEAGIRAAYPSYRVLENDRAKAKKDGAVMNFTHESHTESKAPIKVW